jgi:ATPase, P-type (transporting), HAD superfamily, subfamily IC
VSDGLLDFEREGVDAFDTPVAEQKAEEVLRIRFEIEDLFCVYCKEVIEWVLMRTSGILQAVVDYSTDLVIVDYDPRKINPEEIFAKVKRLRYTPKYFEEEKREKTLHLRLGVSAFFALNIMMFSYSVFVGLFEEDGNWGKLFATLSFFCSLPILGYSAIPIFKRGLISASRGFFGMESLVTLGVCSSFILSTLHLMQGSIEVYFDTSAVIVTFVLLGKVIEQRAKFSAKNQMRLLFKSLPKRARVNDRFILIKELQEGDLITSLSGEKIVVDGRVEEGEGWLDISLLTGESQPVFVHSGHLIKSGSILIEGSLHYIRVEQKSTLESIVELVENALLNKQPTKEWLDYLLPFFVPSVCLLALLSPHPLAVLLISCPCAIGIATPLAESKIIDNLLSIGVVVRNRNALKLLGREKSFVFDKTGTLTTKEFDLTSDLGEYRSIVKTLALQSIHPVAKALSKTLQEVPKVVLSSVKEVMGCGIVGEGRYFLGSPKWLNLEKECSLAFQESGKDPVYLHLEDHIREEVPSLLASLKGVDLYLYSGDRPHQVELVAKKLGIKHFAGNLSPLEKQQKIEGLKKEAIVAFVGDGMNDAAAIGAASLSFVPLNGSDLSSQSADFLLTRDDLTLISLSRFIALKGQRILKQNLFWGFFYNLLGIPLAFFGYLNPILATLFMMISSLTVLFNSNRLNAKFTLSKGLVEKPPQKRR